MRRLDIRLAKVHDKTQAAQQLELVEKLQQILPQRISALFEDIHIRVRLSSSSAVELSGFRSKEEKEQLMAFLEELWTDDSLLET